MFLVKALSFIPLSVFHAFGQFVAFLLYHVFRYRRDVVRQNMTSAFPNIPLRELKKEERKVYINFVDVFLELMKAYQFKKEDWVKRVPLKGADLMLKYLDKGQPVILLSGHSANWEWPAFSIGQQIGYTMEFLYKPIKNGRFNEIMLKLRTKHGGVAIPKDSALRQIIRKKNEPRIIGILADQLPSVGADKYWINFLNQETAFYTGPQKIAGLVNYPVFYSETTRTARGYYQTEFKQVMIPPYQKGGQAIVQKFADLLAETITRNPSDYLWSHKRWKYNQKQEREVRGIA
uniref:lysophospholipid acyltransferase family protein n=1 Tax=Roseivirga sp. TaxID=1964215 RepID=UPI0040480243